MRKARIEKIRNILIFGPILFKRLRTYLLLLNQ